MSLFLNKNRYRYLLRIKKWGEKCVNYFNGMFSFAIWDKRKKNYFAHETGGINLFIIQYIIIHLSFLLKSRL